MGKFTTMLDQLMVVESQGFDMYKESYSARIGQLQASATTTYPSGAVSSAYGTDPGRKSNPYTRAEVVNAYTSQGWDNLWANIPDDKPITGTAMSTWYNNAKSVGLDPQRYLDTVNVGVDPSMQTIINPANNETFHFKEPVPESESNIHYRESYNAQDKVTTRERVNLKTGKQYEKYGDTTEEIERFKKEGEANRLKEEESFNLREAERKAAREEEAKKAEELKKQQELEIAERRKKVEDMKAKK